MCEGAAGSVRRTLCEADRQLGVDDAPILAPPSPFLGNIHHGQIQHFQQAVIGGKDGLGLGHLTKLAVKALNGVGGIDQSPDFLRILEISAEIGPVIPPGAGNLARQRKLCKSRQASVKETGANQRPVRAGHGPA